MHCALKEISIESSTVSKPGKDSLSRKQKQKVLTTSLKVTKTGCSHFWHVLKFFWIGSCSLPLFNGCLLFLQDREESSLSTRVADSR